LGRAGERRPGRVKLVRRPRAESEAHRMPAPTSTIAAPPGMRWIPGGEFSIGSTEFYPEEQPVRRVAVEGFWIDACPVTAGEFRRFVRDTKYVTVAERDLDPDDYPDADPDLLTPGSLVFHKTQAGVGPRPLPPPTRRSPPSTCATSATGGGTCRAHSGSGPPAPARRSTAGIAIP